MFPLTLALATGMSVNNARGVIEAILNHQSEFSRTPKYGIATDRAPDATACVMCRSNPGSLSSS